MPNHFLGNFRRWTRSNSNTIVTLLESEYSPALVDIKNETLDLNTN